LTYVAPTASRTAAPTYAEMTAAREARAEAAEARKRAVEAKAGEALSSPKLKASDTAKQQARAKVQSLIERLRIFKKLFSGDPKQMAKALAQLTKELREAVKAYKAAGGQEMGMTGELARGVTTPAPEAAPDETKATQATGETSGEEPEGPGEDKAEASAVDPAQGGALYEAVKTRMRETLAEGDLDFIKEVRGVVKAVRDLLESARTKAMGSRPDKATQENFKDADEQMKALNKELEDMERDVRRDAPTVGLRLSIAA